MAAKEMDINFKCLVRIHTRLEDGNSASEIHIALKELHQYIKKYGNQVSDFNILTNDEQEMLYSTIKSLILILINDGFQADVMLLCGTCLCLLITTIFNSEFASSFLIYIYCYFDQHYSGSKKISSNSEEFLKNQLTKELKSYIFSSKSCVNFTSEIFKKYLSEKSSIKILQTPSFYQIAVLNGIVSCRAPSLFSLKINVFYNKPFVVFLFDAIYNCCLSPSTHQYHAFNVLLNWMRLCEVCLPAFSKNDNVIFSANSEIVQKVLNLLESNWQSPIKGVNGFVKEIYKILINLSKQECQKFGTDDKELVLYLMRKCMRLSWQVKGKYLMLSAIFQHADFHEVFEQNPDAPSKIISNLKANYIASSVAEVYKVIVTNMKNTFSAEDMCSEWSKWWRKPIIDCLCSNDKLLIQNVTNYILPWTMKYFPASYDMMKKSASQGQDDSIQLLLLHIAKENFPLILGEEELLLIEKNLHHCDIQIRSEILAILCTSPKKSEKVKSKELEFLKCFILKNLNIDSAPFHQYLLSQLRILLTRIRDSLAQEYRSNNHLDNFTLDSSQLEFIDWLSLTAVQNTFPGACYQRRRISLQILNVIFEVFVQSPMGFRRKEKPSKSVELVIEWAQKKNLWQIFNKDMLSLILPCLTDFTDEVRNLSANLLSKYSSWPFINYYHAIKEEEITQFAMSLCNHPNYRNNDGGAHIFCIIFNRLCNKIQESECSEPLTFLKYLVSTAKHQLVSAKEDFLTAAVNEPIHGLLLALQYCLSDSINFMVYSYKSQERETIEFLNESKSLCFDTVQYMLRIMKGDNDDFNCPSFLDIGKAMQKLVISKKNALPNIDAENSTIDKVPLANDENSDYTALCDLLLSCCWHCIKNSCFLLCAISSSVTSLELEYAPRKQILQEISEEFASILIACRHRGVVEACCEALYKFCTSLLKDRAIYEDITMGLLKSVFEKLTDTSVVSVTRRSAGLPLLFQAVVSSEDNNFNRKLLTYTVENLLNFIDKPLPPVEMISDKTDLPQAHAYHILKALVSDARLSQCILPHFSSIVPACVSGFSSSLWAIRNGALQLFGVILPRVCGQKKVRDDDSEYNMVSAFELFARCPSLKTYLLQQLSKCVRFHHEKHLCCELVPVLSLLVKLMPEQEDQREFMIEFRPLLAELLDIPVWKVRDLVSSALSVMMNASEIIKLLEEVVGLLRRSSTDLNRVHSMLLIVQKFLKRSCCRTLSNVSCIENHLKDIHFLVLEKTKCPLLSGMIIDMALLVSEAEKQASVLRSIDDKCRTMNLSQGYEVGIVLYECKAARAHLEACSLFDLPLSLKKLISQNKDIQIVYLQFLSKKLNSERCSQSFYNADNLKIWKEIFTASAVCISPEKHPSVIKEALEFMINLCSIWDAGKVILDSSINLVNNHLLCQLDMQSGLSVSALSFTMWSLCIKVMLEKQDQIILFEKWNSLFNAYCQPRSCDILRMQAARSLAILGPSLAEYLAKNIESDVETDAFVQIFIGLCEGSLLLLQDEDEEIRNEACKFPSLIPHEYSASILQFNVGIEVVFHYSLQVLGYQPVYLLYLWNRLQNFPYTAKILQSLSNSKKINLFEQEYVNVFAEPQQLLLHYQFSLQEILSELFKKNYKLYCEQITMFLHDLKLELEDTYSILSPIYTKTLNQNFTYHHQAFLALKKLRCQVQILLFQKNIILTDDSLVNELDELNAEWKNIEKHLPSVTCWFLNYP